MKRREFITLIGGAAATWALTARAQQAAMPVVGVLGGHTSAEWQSFVAAFNEGLKGHCHVSAVKAFSGLDGAR